MKGVQLPLGVQLAESASFESYFPGPNLETVRALRGLADAPPLLLVYGPPGSGKTHLLQAAIRSAAETQRCGYLPLRTLTHESLAPAETVEGLDALDLVCIDDVEAALAHGEWSEVLARLLDARRAAGLRTVVAAAAGPERLSGLTDLRTRLSAAAIYGVKPLGDADRVAFLQQRAKARGLDLPTDAAILLLTRLPRDLGSLTAALDLLDRAALTAQRRLSLGFVQQWLRERREQA